MINLRSPDTIILKALLGTYAHGVEVWALGRTGSAAANQHVDVLRNPTNLDRPQRGMQELRDAIARSNLTIAVHLLDWALLPEPSRHELSSSHVILMPPVLGIGTSGGVRGV